MVGASRIVVGQAVLAVGGVALRTRLGCGQHAVAGGARGARGRAVRGARGACGRVTILARALLGGALAVLRVARRDGLVLGARARRPRDARIVAEIEAARARRALCVTVGRACDA